LRLSQNHARSFRGHGPIVDWERNGADSVEWHQGQGDYANYRWYGDVSVDNLNAVLYGYALFYDLAADESQRAFIAQEVDELMTHLLDNHCRIVDVDGEPTQWGHVGIDPDPQYDAYYQEMYGRRFRRFGERKISEFPLRAQLMLLPDLLIAHHVTGKPHYLDFYQKVVARHRGNPEPDFYNQPITLERLARFDHSPEGQSYEALYNLIRYEQDPELLKTYRSWVGRLWENNWTEGNSLFALTTLALLPEFKQPGGGATSLEAVPHAAEGLQLGLETLAQYPLERVLRPVMGSLRPGVELNPHVEQGRPQSVTPVPIQLRPHDNEYEWKANPYQLDGWLTPRHVHGVFGRRSAGRLVYRFPKSRLDDTRPRPVVAERFVVADGDRHHIDRRIAAADVCRLGANWAGDHDLARRRPQLAAGSRRRSSGVFVTEVR